jgi:hypothetical protein
VLLIAHDEQGEQIYRGRARKFLYANPKQISSMQAIGQYEFTLNAKEFKQIASISF